MFGSKKGHIHRSLLVLLCILLSACGPSAEELAVTSAAGTDAAITSTYTITPTFTQTPIPPTATPTLKPPTETIEPFPGLIPEGIVVTFEKSGKCSISGPTELAPGEYTFVLIQPPPTEFNRVGNPINGFLDVRYLIDGKITQDLLDHPNYKEGTWWGQALDIIPKADVDDGWSNESRNEKYYKYSLEAGEYIVDRWTQDPHFYWYCGSIFVK